MGVAAAQPSPAQDISDRIPLLCGRLVSSSELECHWTEASLRRGGSDCYHSSPAQLRRLKHQEAAVGESELSFGGLVFVSLFLLPENREYNKNLINVSSMGMTWGEEEEGQMSVRELWMREGEYKYA